MTTENTFCQPSSEWVHFSKSGKAEVAKGGGWTTLFMCSRYSGTLTPTAPTDIKLRETFAFF